MISHYFDTGVAIKLVIEEPLSAKVLAFVEKRTLPIPFSMLLELETENTLHALHFRKEITTRQLAGARNLTSLMLKSGRFLSIAISMDRIAQETLSLVPLVTVKTGCRTLDLMHVATAKILKATHFVSTDRRQLAAARLCGLQATNLE